MALSEHEQQLLDQLERQLHTDDPKFAHSMASSTRRSMSTRKLVIGALITIAGISTLLAGIAYQLIVLGVLGFLIMGAGVYFATTKGRAEAVPSTPGVQPRSASPARPGFMSTLEEKWDERKKDEQ